MSVFETSLEKLKSRVGDIEITPQTLMIIMKYAMEVIEISELKGSEQKEMSIRLIRSVVSDSSLEAEKKSICLQMIDSGALGQTIDLIIDATKGRIQVNQKIIIRNCYEMCPLALWLLQDLLDAYNKVYNNTLPLVYLYNKCMNQARLNQYLCHIYNKVRLAKKKINRVTILCRKDIPHTLKNIKNYIYIFSYN